MNIYLFLILNEMFLYFEFFTQHLKSNIIFKIKILIKILKISEIGRAVALLININRYLYKYVLIIPIGKYIAHMQVFV